MENTTHFVERHVHIGDSVIVERHDIITVASGALKSGINKNGSEWVRRDYRSKIHFSMRSGQLRVYKQFRQQGKRWGTRDITSRYYVDGNGYWDLKDILPALIIQMMERVTGEQLSPSLSALKMSQLVTVIAYPFLRAQNSANPFLWHDPVPGLGPSLRLSEPRDVAASLYGKRRLRKDLIKGVATAQPLQLLITKTVARHVHVDWIVEALRTPIDQNFSFFITPSVISYFGDALSLLPEHRRRNFLLSALRASAQTDINRVRDTLFMIRDLREVFVVDHARLTDLAKDARNWRELHDALLTSRRVVRDTPQEIPQDDIYEALDQMTFGADGQYRFESVKNTTQLPAWGKLMSNCIGSYRHEALKHEAYLFAFVEGDKVIANAEVTPKGELIQLLGKYNEPLDDVLTAVVQKKVRKAVRSVRAARKAAKATQVAA